MRIHITLLPFLFWSLLEVHPETEYPYIERIPLPNHAYINLNLVGEGDAGVRCYTDLDSCCSGSQGVYRGDWIPPGSEESLPFLSDCSADIYQFQGRQRVILRRMNNADMLSGIYRCD